METKIINSKIEQIFNFCGINLEKCDYFTGLRKHKGNTFFNVIIDKKDYNKASRSLNNCVKCGIISRYEKNGIDRYALYL